MLWVPKSHMVNGPACAFRPSEQCSEACHRHAGELKAPPAPWEGRILFHTRPGSLVLAGPFCGKLHGLHVTSCGAKAQSDTGTAVTRFRDSRCKIILEPRSTAGPPSLELCIVSFNDDSWAFQDLGDRSRAHIGDSERRGRT